MVGTTGLVVTFGGLYLVGAAATATTAVVAWRRRRGTTAAVALVVYLGGLAVTCVAELAVLASNRGGLPAVLLVASFAPVVPLSAVMSAALWAMSRTTADPDWHPGRRVLAALAVFPVLTTVAVALNGSEGLFFRLAPHPDAAWPVWVPRGLYLPYTVVLLAFMVGTFRALVRARRHSSPLQRRQAGALLLGMLVPLPSTVLILSVPQGSIPDPTPLSYVATGLISGYALLRLGLLQVVPVARGLVFDRLRDAVVVLGEDRRLIDVNRAGERLLRAARPDLPASLTGLPFDDLLPVRRPVRIQALGQGADGEYELDLPAGRMVLDIRMEDLADARGRPIGRVIVLRDITELFRLREHLAEQAVRDELTGLFNRRHLMRVLERELADAGPDTPDLCLVMVDIDHFKSVNDEHGHLIGDALLAATGRALTGAVRDGDLVARYGGEEFAILLPGLSVEQAVARTEDLRRRCAAATVESTPASGSVPVGRTISAGVVGVRGLAGAGSGPLTPAALLQAADAALYRAKESGRNRVVAA